MRVAEPVGSRLIALSASAVVAIVAGNLAPPGRSWSLPLAALALLSAWRGLAVSKPRLAWWAACGALVGLAACALAPRAPAGYRARPVPVRFTVTVRDGWIAGFRGLGTRVRIGRLEAAGEALRAPRETDLYVTSQVGLAALPRPGTRWEGSGELVFDPDLPLKAGYLRVKSLIVLRPVPGGSPVDRLREAAFRSLRASAGVDPVRLRASALAAALVLERREALLEGEVASMRRSGLVHLLSVSGLHVGLVGVLAWGALALAGVRPAPRRWLTAAVLVGFALLAGGNAPVRRAATAAVAYLAARQFGRPLEPLSAVWGIVAGLSLMEPAVLVQPGFELSAFVTLALVRWITPVAAWLRVLPQRAAQTLAVALVAQGASAPLVGGYFAVVPPLGVVANLLAAPLELVLVAASLLALIAAPVWPFLGALALDVLAVGQRLLGHASSLGGLASWPFAPPGAVAAAVAVALGLVALTRVRGSKAAALLLVAATVAWMVVPVPRIGPAHEVRALGVREGMALLLRSGRDALLVDTGRAPLDAWRELARERVSRLDAVVVTHPDSDHTGGAAMILERLRVDRFCYPLALAGSAELVSLRRLARSRGIEEVPLVAGQRLAVGGVLCDLVWPPPAVSGIDNDASLAARLVVGGVRVLIAGDLEGGGEAAILARNVPVRAEILQLSHHGSRTSSSLPFLVAVRPVIALAATGARPRFGYPHPVVVRRARGIPAVVVVQSGGSVAVGWDDAGPLTVGTSAPVRVARSRERALE